MLKYEQSTTVNWVDPHEGFIGIGSFYSPGGKNEEI
jgi:hypothetical protein